MLSLTTGHTSPVGVIVLAYFRDEPYRLESLAQVIRSGVRSRFCNFEMSRSDQCLDRFRQHNRYAS